MKGKLTIILIVMLTITTPVYAKGGGGTLDKIFRAVSSLIRTADSEIHKSMRQWEREAKKDKLEREKAFRKEQNERAKQEAQERGKTTREYFNENLKHISDEKLADLKKFLDIKLGRTGLKLDKESKDYRKKLSNHLRGRFKNQRLGEKDHKWIKGYIENAPNEKSLSEFEKMWAKYYLNPNSDLYIGETNTMILLPTQPPVIQAPAQIPLLAY